MGEERRVPDVCAICGEPLTQIKTIRLLLANGESFECHVCRECAVYDGWNFYKAVAHIIASTFLEYRGGGKLYFRDVAGIVKRMCEEQPDKGGLVPLFIGVFFISAAIAADFLDATGARTGGELLNALSAFMESVGDEIRGRGD